MQTLFTINFKKKSHPCSAIEIFPPCPPEIHTYYPMAKRQSFQFRKPNFCNTKRLHLQP